MGFSEVTPYRLVCWEHPKDKSRLVFSSTAHLAFEVWVLGFYLDFVFEALVIGKIRSLEPSLHMRTRESRKATQIRSHPAKRMSREQARETKKVDLEILTRVSQSYESETVRG